LPSWRGNNARFGGVSNGENSDHAMVVMMMAVMVTPVVAMMSSMRLDHNYFPFPFRFMMGGGDRLAVLCQKRGKIQGYREQNQD
jgi:hypothetical protein